DVFGFAQSLGRLLPEGRLEGFDAPGESGDLLEELLGARRKAGERGFDGLGSGLPVRFSGGYSVVRRRNELVQPGRDPAALPGLDGQADSTAASRASIAAIRSAHAFPAGSTAGLPFRASCEDFSGEAASGDVSPGAFGGVTRISVGEVVAAAASPSPGGRGPG